MMFGEILIPNDLLDDLDGINRFEVVTYGALQLLFSSNLPTNNISEISRYSRCSRPTVYKSLKGLIEKGWVKVIDNGDSKPSYIPVLDKGA